MKRVLVTGGTGFIGRCAVKSILELGCEVHITTSQKVSVAQFPEGVHVHRCDLLDELQQHKLFEAIRPTYLLHFAWDVTHGKFWRTENNLIWVQASLNLLKTFKQFGGERVVFAGTCAEYDWRYGYCVEGVTPLAPNTLYGVCKNSLNGIFQTYCFQENISAAWGRIFHLYGPNEVESRFVPSIICSMLKQEIVKCSECTQIRDFMHVEDVACAFVFLLNSEVQGDVNIASGVPVSLKSIVELISDCTNYSGVVDFGALPMSDSEPPLLVATVRRLQHEVQFTSKYSLEKGVESTVKYWNQTLIKEEYSAK